MEPSSKLLLQKLGLKEGTDAVFLHVPTDVKRFCPVVRAMSQTLGKDHDVILTFCENSKAMKIELPLLKGALKSSGMIWVCWRKGHDSDLDREVIWQLGEECGLNSVSSIAIDDVWSAMKLMYPKEQRRRYS